VCVLPYVRLFGVCVALRSFLSPPFGISLYPPPLGMYTGGDPNAATELILVAGIIPPRARRGGRSLHLGQSTGERSSYTGGGDTGGEPPQFEEQGGFDTSFAAFGDDGDGFGTAFDDPGQQVPLYIHVYLYI